MAMITCIYVNICTYMTARVYMHEYGLCACAEKERKKTDTKKDKIGIVVYLSSKWHKAKSMVNSVRIKLNNNI